MCLMGFWIIIIPLKSNILKLKLKLSIYHFQIVYISMLYSIDTISKQKWNIK